MCSLYMCLFDMYAPYTAAIKNFIANYFTEFHSNYSYLYTDLYFYTLIIYTGF